ncbi:hypothetical protein [Marinobacter sp. VGCF2001]|uniref:hypothetical protein n=1 Tax=Marinobacter sp. VGCF2001 TaxID=3417189 RepID=UPI003CEAD151
MKPHTTLMAAGVMMASLLAASPAALAGKYGMHHENGKWDKQELCENYRSGQGPFDRQARQAEMAQQRAEMADRLQLSEEQRQIWSEMHQERQARHEQRMKRWQKTMEQRCSGTAGKSKK